MDNQLLEPEVNEEKELNMIFNSFCSFGTRKVVVELEGVKFSKLCRDCKLIDGRLLTPTQVDLIFAKVKTKGSRRISFVQFLQALELIAEKKAMSVDAVRRIIVSAKGPIANATKANYNKFHDDKNMYTGVYRRKTHVTNPSMENQEITSHLLRFDKLFNDSNGDT